MPKYLVIILVLSNLREFFGAVLKGSRAKDGQFPWLVQFHTIAPCGGVLVSPDWVLTAAQCVEQKRSSIELYATGLNGTGSSQTVSVKATYMFPQYRAYSKTRDYENNIALLKLVRSFDICDEKVRLLDTAPVRFDDDYKSCLIFGWQSTLSPSSKVHAKPVLYSKVLLNSWRLCMYMHEVNASYKNVFCTMVDDELGIRACAGNPGSPVVCEDRYERMVLLGIASWSNFSLDCGGLPTYLGVSVFRSWMGDLIFGNKNIEEWEMGVERGKGGCREDRHIGGIRGEINWRSKVADYTEIAADLGKNSLARGLDFGKKSLSRDLDSEKNYLSRDLDLKNEDFDDFSWKDSVGGRTMGAGRIEAKRMGNIVELGNKLEPPIFGNSEDYGRILGEDGPRRVKDFDVVREREEQLSQYREIGRNRKDEGFEEPVVMGSDQEKRKIFVGKGGRTVERDEEIFDDFELIMPNGIESFDRSAAVTGTKHFGYIAIIAMCFCKLLCAIVR